jgi:Trk K+ transport system NAD-binding subunit
MWRGLAFAAVFSAGLVGLLVGVGVTQRDLADAHIAEKAYYALGLFVLGGLDIGTPVGGPVVGRLLLWSAYFLAPVITASALLEAAVRLIGPLALRVRPLSHHVVIGGAGRLTMLYVRKLRGPDPRRTIVVVEQDLNHARLSQLRDLYRAVIVPGDVTSDEVLASLRLDRAHRVLLLAGDDFANLDAAAKILRMAPDLGGRVVAHVSDLGFMRETAGSSVARECVIFNGHEFAAKSLVRERLLRRFQSTPHRDLVVLAGFGRFGQTVLHQLQELAHGSFGHVVIIDEHATRNARGFEDEPGFSDDYERAVVDGDLLDREIWRRVGQVVSVHGHEPVIVVGSGNDGTNLHVALAVRKQHPGAYVIARSFEASPFTAEIAQEAGIHAFGLAELIESGMPEAWF